MTRIRTSQPVPFIALELEEPIGIAQKTRDASRFDLEEGTLWAFPYDDLEAFIEPCKDKHGIRKYVTWLHSLGYNCIISVWRGTKFALVPVRAVFSASVT